MRTKILLIPLAVVLVLALAVGIVAITGGPDSAAIAATQGVSDAPGPAELGNPMHPNGPPGHKDNIHHKPGLRADKDICADFLPEHAAHGDHTITGFVEVFVSHGISNLPCDPN